MNRAIRIACELAGLHINLNDAYFQYMEDDGSVVDRFDKMPEHWFLRHRAGWQNLVRELSSLTKDYPISEEILERLKAGDGKFASHEEAKAGGIVVTASDATPAWQVVEWENPKVYDCLIKDLSQGVKKKAVRGEKSAPLLTQRRSKVSTRGHWGPNPDLMMAFVPTCHFRKVSGTPRKDLLVRRSRPSMPKSS